MTDAFGREIKSSLDDLQGALLKDLGQQKENAQSRDENTEQLKALNKKIDDILNGQFSKELKALEKMVGKVAKTTEDIQKKKANRETERRKDAEAIGKAVARNMSKGGGDLSDDLKKMLASFDNVTGRALTFGEVLERSQRRFGTAFGMIGKQFKQDFGAFGISLRKFNPFKMMAKEAAKGEPGFRDQIAVLWSNAMKSVGEKWSDLTANVSTQWEGLKNNVAQQWNSLTTAVSDKFNQVTQGIKERAQQAWDAAAKYVSESWLGKTATGIKKSYDTAANKISQYLGPLGKAIKGTVGDLFKMGKNNPAMAQRDINDLLAPAVKKPMVGEDVTKGKTAKTKGKGIKVDFNDDNLCRCICRCIGKLMGIEVKEAKTRKKDAQSSQSVLSGISSGLSQVKKSTDGSGDKIRDEMAREEARRSKLATSRESFTERGKSVKGLIDAGQKRLSGFSTALLSAETNVKTMAQMMANAASKTAGFIAGKPLGGLAEGLVSLVLQPLVEEVGNFQEEMQAMYTLRGATGAITPEGGLNRMSQGVKDYADGVDIAAKKEEMLKRTVEEITETGQKLSLIQKQHIKNIKMGLREEDKFNKASNIGLRAGAQIGADAGHTADMFADWKRSLGLTNVQLGAMDRGLLSIARTTGVFGDQLREAAQHSKEFMEHMRMSGTFTAKAANNIIGLMAEAEKRGVSKGVGNLLRVLQGSLIGTQGSEGARMVAMMGMGQSRNVHRAMLTGTLLQNRSAQKEMAENLGARLDEFALQRYGKLYKDLSIEEKGFMDPFIRSLTNGEYGIEELNQTIQTLRERSKGFSDRMKDLDKEAEKSIDRKLVQNKKEQLIYDTAHEVLDDFNRALKESGGDVNAAFAKIKDVPDTADFLRTAGIDLTKGGTEAIGDVLKKQAEQLTSRAKREGLTTEVEGAKIDEKTINDAMKNLADGNREDFDNLMARMTALEGKTREQMRQNADPATKMLMIMFKMEGYLRIMARQALTELSPMAAGGIQAFEEVMDKAAKEFVKNTPEGRENAIKIIGEAMQKLPAEITKANQQIQKIPGATPLQKTAATGLDLIGGKDTFLGGLTEKIGKLLHDNAKLIADAIDRLTTKINQALEDINKHIDDFKNALNVVVAVLVAGGLIAAIGGLATALGGLAGILVGPVGLTALAIGAGVAIGTLVNKLRDLPNEEKQDAQKGKDLRDIGAKLDEEYEKNKAKRSADIRKLDMENIDKQIAYQRTRQEEYRKQFEAAPKFWSLARQWLRPEATKTEQESLNRIVKENEKINADITQLLQQKERLSLRGKDTTGKERWLGISEAGKRFQENIKDVDQQSKAQFSTAKTLEDMKKILEQERQKAEKAYIAQQDTPEGIAESIRIAQEYSKKLNAFDEAAKQMQKPGSIFVHDIHLEKLIKDEYAETPDISTLEYRPDRDYAMAKTLEYNPERDVSTVTPLDKRTTPVKPVLPNAKNVEEQLRLKQAEAQTEGADMAKTESNTGATAAGVGALIRLVGRIGKALMKKRKDNNLGVDGPDYPLDSFFEEVLSTEWPNARLGRTVGLEFDYDNIG